MIWTQDINPRVWKGGTFYVAMALDNWVGLEEGYIAYIYRAVDFPDVPIRGPARWGRTVTAALTRAVKVFDPEATLPEEVH